MFPRKAFFSGEIPSTISVISYGILMYSALYDLKALILNNVFCFEFELFVCISFLPV